MSSKSTSCVWRRETLDATGSWSSEAVAEDLNLTANILLGGWEFVYTGRYAAPCETPVALSGFVRQYEDWSPSGVAQW
jgi:cellulose synthase (UDP-forming)